MWLSADFCLQKPQARRKWYDIFKLMKEKKQKQKPATKALHPARLHSDLMEKSKVLETCKAKII